MNSLNLFVSHSDFEEKSLVLSVSDPGLRLSRLIYVKRKVVKDKFIRC